MDVATIRPDVLARFWAKVNPCGPVHPTLGSACWLWTAAVGSGGYGVVWQTGSLLYAHRFAYEAVIGPVPEGLHIDHLCRVRNCVRPDHLEPVTQRENILRGVGMCAVQAKRTHCPQGHPYSGDNLYVLRGKRYCRECVRKSNRERAARKRLHAPPST